MGEGRESANCDLSWAAYPNTVVTLGDGVTARLDLRRPMTAADQERIAHLGARSPFAIITACNPRGRTVTSADNDHRTATLRSELRARSIQFVTAVGESPDGVHREIGVAAEMPLSEAAATAVSYEQSALFWYDGQAFWLIGALVESRPVRLLIHGRARVTAVENCR